MSNQIFISYRREDSSGSTGRIYDRLIEHFPESKIFIDIDSIDLGEDFVTYIENSVRKCDIMLVIIGSRWLELIKKKSEEIDFVRLEVASAIKNNIKVIPILLENTKMPSPTELPEDIRVLSRRNAFLINHISFNSEIEKLVANLKRLSSIAGQNKPNPISKKMEATTESNTEKSKVDGHSMDKPIEEVNFNQPSLVFKQEEVIAESVEILKSPDKSITDFEEAPLIKSPKFTITQDKKFESIDFPGLEIELKILKEKLPKYSSQNSVDIIIGFAKNHSLKNDWIANNPELAKDVINQEIRVKEIEKIFSLSQSNITFQDQLQKYLREQLNEIEH